MVFPPHRQFKGLIKGKVLSGCGRKRAPSDSVTFLSLSFCFSMCITYVFAFKFWVSLVFMLWLFNIYLFGNFSVLLCFVFHKKIKKKLKNQKNTKTVCVLCTLVLVYLEWPLKQNLLSFVLFVA